MEVVLWALAFATAACLCVAIEASKKIVRLRQSLRDEYAEVAKLRKTIARYQAFRESINDAEDELQFDESK